MHDGSRVVIRNVTDVFSVGKTKVRITTDGCVRCGTEYSSGWHLDRVVIIEIGTRRGEIAIQCCADCKAKKEPGLFDGGMTR